MTPMTTGTNFMTQKKIDIANWKIGDKKEAYRNPFFTVFSYEAVLPNDTQSTYYILEKHPFSIVIPVTERNTLVLVAQYRPSMRQVSWEFPMGSVKGKTPREMAVQELKEETGYTAEKLTELGNFFVAPGHSNSRAYVYTAQGLTAGQATPEANEFFETREVTVLEFEKMVRIGVILDGPTISAFYYYKSTITT